MRAFCVHLHIAKDFEVFDVLLSLLLRFIDCNHMHKQHIYFKKKGNVHIIKNSPFFSITFSEDSL